MSPASPTQAPAPSGAQVGSNSRSYWNEHPDFRTGALNSRTAAVVAEKLDRLLARDRPDSNGLHCAFQRRGFNCALKRLRHASGDQQQCHDDGDGQQYVERRADRSTQKLPIASISCRTKARVRASAIAVATAESRKLWVVRPAICEK